MVILSYTKRHFSPTPVFEFSVFCLFLFQFHIFALNATAVCRLIGGWKVGWMDD